MHTAGAASRRPELHFTPPRGWLNDPYGICWVNDRYHLFYQHNPDDTRWTWDLSWGHATSTDLIHWQYQPAALVPAEGEGCWSGTTLVQHDQPIIVYTSITADNWNHGRIAIALPDAAGTQWRADGILIDGPPKHLAAKDFRDPYIFANSAGWTMIVGGGLADGTPVVFQYTSEDTRTWTYGGVVCSGPAGTIEDGTGVFWECPQLFQIGDDWVLVVSVGDNISVPYVQASIGRYDGDTFRPERWQRLAHDTTSYAMTAFIDRSGRPCLMCWLREDDQHDPDAREWSGALSLPMTVTTTSTRSLRLEPHPALRLARDGWPVQKVIMSLEPAQYPVQDLPLDLELEIGTTDERVLITLESQNEGQMITLTSVDSEQLCIQRQGHTTIQLPRSSAQVRMVIDVGIVSIFAGEGASVIRIPPTGDLLFTISGPS